MDRKEIVCCGGLSEIGVKLLWTNSTYLLLVLNGRMEGEMYCCVAATHNVWKCLFVELCIDAKNVPNLMLEKLNNITLSNWFQIANQR